MTSDSLADASVFFRVIEKRQDNKVECIKEIAYRMGFIIDKALEILAKSMLKSGYGEYLKRILQ